MKFSVVLPVHNEEGLLPYSLPSVLRLEPDEVVFLFDRCTDRSIEVTKEIMFLSDVQHCTPHIQCLNIENEADWFFQLTYLRRQGYLKARNNIVLSTGADILLDKHVVEALKIFESEPDVALVSLGCLDYPISPRNLIANLAGKLMNKLGFPRFYGPFFFRRDLWLRTLELEEAKQRRTISEDAPLWLALLKHYKMRFLNTKCLHLRADESWKRNYYRGAEYWSVAGRTWLFALASSVFMIRPSLLVGYIHERMK